MMERSDTFILAQEGWRFLAVSLGLFVVSVLFDWDFIQWMALIATGLLAYIYRNPERIVPYYQSGSIVAIADGRVVAIDTVDNGPFIEGPCYKVEIVSSIFDVALLRAPFSGKIRHLSLRRGSRLSALQPLSKQLNEQAVVEFSGEQDDQQCAVEHMLDRSFDALSLHVHESQTVPQGGRYGLMLKGTHTLYLPEKSRVAVKVGDEVYAGATLIGYFA